MTDTLNPLDEFLEVSAEAYGARTVARWVLGGESLTYAELKDRSRRCAAGLAALGVGSGTHVAMMLPSCPAGTITWFALARLGAVLTPLNPSYVADELAYALTTADVEVLIIDQPLTDLLQKPEMAGVDLRHVIVRGAAEAGRVTWDSLLAGAPDTAPQPMRPDGLFSIQYTSGTTGRPKGCMLTQAYWRDLGGRTAEELDGLGVRNTMIWSPFFYMDAQWQLLMTMLVGGTAHIVEQMSLTRLGGWLSAFGIEYLSFPEPFMQSLDADSVPEWPLKFVNTFAWRPHNIAKLRQMFGPIGRDAFGMTELGGVAAMPIEADLETRAGSCGVAIDGAAMRIVDEKGADVPTGSVGELVVQTPHRLLGYYNNPEATADAFFGDWFRSGDLAALDGDGYLYIKGRLKEMIKRSGENIAAREVEATIMQHPAVQEAAVVAVPDPIRKEEVKAFIILRDGEAQDEAQARSIAQHCRDRLAPFKQPRYIEFADDLPRTATRKVAKQQLSDWPVTGADASWDQTTWS